MRRIFWAYGYHNSDGSRPEMCGNGIRCVAQYLFDQGEVTAGAAFTVGTDAGDKG